MKNLFKSIYSVWCTLLMLPTWLLVAIKRNPRLKGDIVQWCKWKQVPHNVWGVMRLVAASYPEFRSLIYYRIGGKYLVQWLLNGQKNTIY